MKTRLLIIAVTALTTFSVQANSSESELLKGKEIRKAVSGKRIYLAAPLGGEFPLYYRADGQVDGSGEAVGLGKFMRPKDTGRWWVDGNRLCQRWTTWYEGRPHCFTLSMAGEGRIAWNKDNGQKGVARIGD